MIHLPYGLPCRLLFVAKGGTWSPSTHHLWPDAFKAAVRALLLAAGSGNTHASAGIGGIRLADQEQHCQPAAITSLPAGIVISIIRLEAAPMSAWDSCGIALERRRQGLPQVGSQVWHYWMFDASAFESWYPLASTLGLQYSSATRGPTF